MMVLIMNRLRNLKKNAKMNGFKIVSGEKTSQKLNLLRQFFSRNRLRTIHFPRRFIQESSQKLYFFNKKTVISKTVVGQNHLRNDFFLFFFRTFLRRLLHITVLEDFLSLFPSLNFVISVKCMSKKMIVLLSNYQKQPSITISSKPIQNKHDSLP